MKSLQSVIQALSFDPLFSRVFMAAGFPEIASLAGWLAEADPYGEGPAIRRALAMAGAPAAKDLTWYEHQLWCAWRQAAWTAERARPLPVRTSGHDWLAETKGRPTLLVTPMTLCPADGLHMIRQLENLDRPCIVFGEAFDAGPGAPTGLEIVGEMSLLTIRRIMAVLEEGGVLCTYPDFVYAGRTAAEMPLFGTRRPVSAGFLALAARNGTMLAPLVCLRDGEGIELRIDEPVEVRAEGAGREAARAAVAEAVGGLLEDLISLAPDQWLLLPTLTFDAPQVGRARPPVVVSGETLAADPAPVA